MKNIYVILLGCYLGIAIPTHSQVADTKVSQKEEEPSIWKRVKSGWAMLEPTERPAVETLITDYKQFLQEARTEITAVQEVIKRAQAKRFVPWTGLAKIKPGDRFFLSISDRALFLVTIGQEPITQGMKMIAPHIDSPRLELKARPFYQPKEQELVLVQTQTHGSIKNYQWVHQPLAMIGEIVRMDGSSIPVRMGLQATDPVIMIPDVAPHEDKEFRELKYPILKTEQLDPLVGSNVYGGKALANILDLVKAQYKIKEEDLVGAELALVPAMPPRDGGLDRSFVIAYGQDDKSSTFAAIRSLLDQTEIPRYTELVFLADNEEMGNINRTGSNSSFLRDFVQQLLSSQGNSSPGGLYQALRNSLAISADTTTGIHPLFAKETQEESNASRLGFGVVVKIYASSKAPPPRVFAPFRKLFFEHKIPWQTQTPHGDVGGGNTLGGTLSAQGIEVIDLGIPVFGQHAPYEISSKVDMYYLHKTFQLFFSNSFPLVK